MPEQQYLHDLETLNDYEEIFQFTKNIIKSDCNFDGMVIVINDKKKEKFVILTEDLQWREMTALPESMIKAIFETKTPQIVSEPTENPSFNQGLDCSGEEEVSALLLYPAESKDQNIEIVFSFWKKFKKEKDEIMEPLIVGSQMVGVTTRVKNTLIPTSFKKEDLIFIQSIEESLLVAVSKLMAQIETQKDTVLNQITKDEQVFNTPQEIIATLVNILMGTNTSIQNLKDTLVQIKEQIHHNDKIMPQVVLMKEILDTLDQNLTNTFQFSTTNNVIQELFKGKDTIKTEEFFRYFGTFGQDIVCQKKLSLNFFLDPRLPSEMKIEKQSTYIFLTELLRFSFDDAQVNTHFNINILAVPQKSTVFFKITYNVEIKDSQAYRNMFIGNQAENNILEQSIHLAYKKFVQTGGKVSISADVEKGQVSFTITTPFESHGFAPLVNPIKKNNVKVGLLLNKEENYQSANNIARYLLALGIVKTQVKGAEKIKLFHDDLTHLIVFQSMFSKELFEDTLKNKPYHIMIISDGCVKEEVTFYDFSMVDYEVDKNSFYLHDLEEFIQLESE